MEALMHQPEQLARLCEDANNGAGLGALEPGLQALIPGSEVKRVLTRGNWYRLGGVVNAGYERVTDNIAHWAERESGGDVDELIYRYMDKGYFATRYAGKTHYFTIPGGDAAGDFTQLEIEELQEVLDRPLIDRDWFPDSLEEFLDPLDYPRLEPEAIGRPRFVFRRITPVASLLDDVQRMNRTSGKLERLFQDWDESSATEGEHFCRHWVLALRQYMDSDGVCRFTARPVSTFAGELPALPAGESLQGVELARAIHDYDRRIGYPFAWYFTMLCRKADNYTLAEAVLRDLMGAYDYLPARDLRVLRRWVERPCGV